MQGTDAIPTAEQIELYVPRKCAASNKIIAAKDHAAIQLDIAEVDEQTGRITGKNRTYALCGSIRMMGEADDSLVRLATRDGFVGKGFYLKDTK
jgi:small subunit ribosomal protein S21e